MIKRSVTVEVVPTPEEMADCFWTYGADMQAEFLNALYYRGPERAAERLVQWARISMSGCITHQGRRIMSELGEYSISPESTP